jgi:hypothetical protein
MNVHTHTFAAVDSGGIACKASFATTGFLAACGVSLALSVGSRAHNAFTGHHSWVHCNAQQHKPPSSTQQPSGISPVRRCRCQRTRAQWARHMYLLQAPQLAASRAESGTYTGPDSIYESVICAQQHQAVSTPVIVRHTTFVQGTLHTVLPTEAGDNVQEL